MEGKARILYITYITNFSRASPDTSNQELTVIINSIRDTANHNYSSHNAINWVTCSPSLCRSIETVQVPWPATGVQENLWSHLEKKRRGAISAGELWFSGSGAVGAIVNLKKPLSWIAGQRRRGPSVGCTAVSAPEVGSRMGCSQWPHWTPGPGLQHCNCRSCRFGTLTTW